MILTGLNLLRGLFLFGTQTECPLTKTAKSTLFVVFCGFVFGILGFEIYL